MRLVRARAPRPAHALPEPLETQTKPRRSRAPLVIFAAYAVLIVANEWRLQSQVAAADGSDPVPAIEDVVIGQP